MYRWTTLMLLGLLMFGCSSKAPTGESIPLDKVPTDIRKVADQKLPNVKFEQATKRADGGYEIRGKDAKGKVRDIDLTAQGDVIEIE